MKTKLLVTALSIVLMSWPKTAAAQCSTYGGRATVVQANGLGVAPVVLSDTGNINSIGGVNDASLLNGAVPSLVSGEVLSATAGGEGSFSHSVASLANLNLTVAGNTIGVDFVVAHADASCISGSPTASGSTEIDGLVVNGVSIAPTGSPNQTLSLLGGAAMILNEQTSTQNGSIAVNAIHVTVPGVTDVVIDSTFAAISGQLVGTSGGPLLFVGLLLQDVFIHYPPCPNPNTASGFPCACTDFFTGGGWINTSSSISSTSAKKTFGVSGGVHPNGTLFAHLEYIDHGNGMNVHGTDVTDCIATSPISRHIDGTARVNGVDGYTYSVDVSDNDVPGPDTFAINVSGSGPPSVSYTAGDNLGSGGNGGGDIEIHPD
jgi:hypothetical protein